MRDSQDDRMQGTVRPGLDQLTLLIAASRKVEPVWVLPRIGALLTRLPKPTRILLRVGANTEPGPVEREVWSLATVAGHAPTWVVPESGQNRKGTFVRDIEMVAAADAVLVFLTKREDPLGPSGTAHVLQKAVDANIPLFAYAVGPGGFEWVGGIDAPVRLTTLSDMMSVIAKTALTKGA